MAGSYGSSVFSVFCFCLKEWLISMLAGWICIPNLHCKVTVVTGPTCHLSPLRVLLSGGACSRGKRNLVLFECCEGRGAVARCVWSGPPGLLQSSPGNHTKQTFYCGASIFFCSTWRSFCPISLTTCYFLCDSHSDRSDMGFQHSLTYVMDIYTFMFASALPTTVKLRNHPGHPSRDTEIKENMILVYMHSGVQPWRLKLYCQQPEISTGNTISQTQKDNSVFSLICRSYTFIDT